MAAFRPEYDSALDLPEVAPTRRGAASGSARATERLGPDGSPSASLCVNCNSRPPLAGAGVCQACLDTLEEEAGEPSLHETMTALYERGPA